MSFFYLTPVKGNMPVHLIEIILYKRLEYLKAVIKGENIEYNEYVVEGSIYDNVGHYMLCIIVIMGVNREFLQFFMKAEIELFKRRLAYLTAYDLRTFAKRLLRNIKKQEYVSSSLNPLQVLCRHLIIKDLAQHVCSSQHESDCDIFKIKLDFRHCHEFIAKREVELQNGTAFVSCSKWKRYLTILFSNHLRHRLQNTDLNTLKSDPRVMELLQKVRRDFFIHSNKDSTKLLSHEIENASKIFPPCMLNLHRSLRKKHRLSHSQRFYYSLFLKDIGMPVEEAVQFWKAEYKQNPNGSHSCCHNWERDEKKYLYGIRHMYGLEGCRKNYTSVNCQRIQSIDNACHEGGCPFKSFDNNNMLSLIRDPTEELVSQINNLKKKSQFTKACLLYLSTLIETVDCDNLSFNFTPVKYYTMAAKSHCLQ